MADAQSHARVLLVGLGRQGRRHLRVAAMSARGDVVATVDPHADGVEGVPHHRTIAEAVEAGGPVDAAVVATPATDHLHSAGDLLERGIPTLVEKPMAFDLDQGRRLLEVARRTGTLLAVGHVERFNPCVQLVSALLDGGTLGAPVAMSFRRVGLPPPSRPDVDVIADLAVHDIDVFAMLAGGPAAFLGASGWIGPDHLVESAHVLLGAGRVHGLVEVNWRTPVRIRGFAITTEQCLVEVNYTTQSVEVVEASKVEEFEEFSAFQSHYGAARRTRLEARVAEPLAEQLDAFLGAVQGTPSRFLATADDGLAVMALAAAASSAVHAEASSEGAP